MTGLSLTVGVMNIVRHKDRGTGMAKRRMFSLDVVDTDDFMDMPVTAQCLYFHLGMRADDDGFVSSPKKITKMIGCRPDDLEMLVKKSYVIPFESGVVVIKDWRVNNYIRSDRYAPTRYVEEMKSITEQNGVYTKPNNRE